MRKGDGHKTVIEVATYFNSIGIDKKVNVIIFVYLICLSSTYVCT
jgi:hypothetical protein